MSLWLGRFKAVAEDWLTLWSQQPCLLKEPRLKLPSRITWHCITLLNVCLQEMINARQLSLPAALSALIVLVAVIVLWIPNFACFSESTVDPPVLYSSVLSESSLLCLLSSLSSSVFFCQGTIKSVMTEYLFVTASQLVFWEEQVCFLGWKWCKHFLHLTCSSLLLLCRELSVLASSLCVITFSSGLT